MATKRIKIDIEICVILHGSMKNKCPVCEERKIKQKEAVRRFREKEKVICSTIKKRKRRKSPIL